ncbi:MAG: hypothetical protein ACKVOP_05170 [Sphingomonadaceae bacterium]
MAIEQVTGLSKWLTASLFAANSGGLLTIINQSDKLATAGLAGVCFIIGLVFALLSATANQEIYNRMASPLTGMVFYWGEVSISGAEDSEDHDKIATRINAVNKWIWLGAAIGWLSGLSFIVGVVTVALGLKGA